MFGIHRHWNRKRMPRATRAKISKSVKAWWTPERRRLHSINMREIAWRRNWERNMQELYTAAIVVAQAEGWPYTQISQFWEGKYREWWKAHDDSDDFEIIHGQVVRTKIFGKPCPPDTPLKQLTEADHKYMDLVGRYRDWDRDARHFHYHWDWW